MSEELKNQILKIKVEDIIKMEYIKRNQIPLEEICNDSDLIPICWYNSFIDFKHIVEHRRSNVTFPRRNYRITTDGMTKNDLKLYILKTKVEDIMKIDYIILNKVPFEEVCKDLYLIPIRYYNTYESYKCLIKDQQASKITFQRRDYRITTNGMTKNDLKLYILKTKVEDIMKCKFINQNVI